MRRIAIGVCAAALLASVNTANAADAARGKITFMQQCAMCHTILSGQRDSMGPNLFGVVGRKAGTKPGFAYSDAMKNSGITWTTDSLKTFVLNPAGTVSGSNMMYMGLSVPAQADDLVAYIATLK